MEIIVSFIVGFVVGALVARNNIKKLNVLVNDAKELADKAEAELKELKAKSKPKPKRKPSTRKTTTKKK